MTWKSLPQVSYLTCNVLIYRHVPCPSSFCCCCCCFCWVCLALQAAVDVMSHSLLQLLCVIDLQGEGRVRTLRHWCQLLQQLHPDNLPADHHYTLSTLPPGSPQPGRSHDNEWQQLHVAKLDMAASKLAVSVPAHALSRPQQPAHAVAPSAESPPQSQHADKAATGSAAEFWLNQVLYVGQLADDQEQELLTFRELFLHSYALENIIVGVPLPASLPAVHTDTACMPCRIIRTFMPAHLSAKMACLSCVLQTFPFSNCLCPHRVFPGAKRLPNISPCA